MLEVYFSAAALLCQFVNTGCVYIRTKAEMKKMKKKGRKAIKRQQPIKVTPGALLLLIAMVGSMGVVLGAVSAMVFTFIFGGN